MGHAEDQVIVAHRQQFLLALGEPLFASVGLALGTVPVTTRIVGDGLMAAVGALIAMSAERSGAAAGDSIEHLPLRPCHRVFFPEPAACCTDHIGYLEGRPRHPCRSSCVVRSVSWSSGLIAACR